MNAQDLEQRGMSLAVALDFADNPRPYHSMACPADTNGELYRALKTLAAALRQQPAPVVDDALRKLIEADKEYDEARRWWDQECYTGLEGFSYETRVATADRFEEALARRAAALARAQGVQP